MKFTHIGWYRNEAENSDKVWGIICIAEDVNIQDSWSHTENKYVTFWGRRGKKLQTKLWEGSDWEANEMFRKKTRDGYVEVNKNKLDIVYPEFQDDLEKTAVWALLCA